MKRFNIDAYLSKHDNPFNEYNKSAEKMLDEALKKYYRKEQENEKKVLTKVYSCDII